MIAYNTFTGMKLFGDEIKESFILHIPHSSIQIPDLTGFNTDEPKLIENELLKMTDWDTDKIFNVPGMTHIVTEFSRIFCDVERFYPDNSEPMAKYGRGFFYTKTDEGTELRNNLGNIKESIYRNYYLKHHKKLSDKIDRKLRKLGVVHIIDCHSFSNVPFKTDIVQSMPRPDICIGIDDFHTPQYLLDFVKCHFEEYKYSVQINNPYSGTMIPKKFYKKNYNVKSIMIEINRKLYMEGTNINLLQVIHLNRLINSLFSDF